MKTSHFFDDSVMIVPDLATRSMANDQDEERACASDSIRLMGQAFAHLQCLFFELSISFHKIGSVSQVLLSVTYNFVYMGMD